MHIIISIIMSIIYLITRIIPDRDLIDCGPKYQFKTMDQSQSKNNTTNINNNSTANNNTANNNTMTKLATNTRSLA